MNNVQLGSCRDRQILDKVDQCRALNTDQIAALLFRQIKTAQRKAQERVKRLFETKQLKRRRYSVSDPYVYYHDKLSGRMDHLIGVNWVYVWLMSTMRSWEQPASWEYEQDYGILQCDAFWAAKNTVNGTYRLIFVEFDRSSNPWDKTAKYNALYKSGGYGGRWWVQHTDRFPMILCVTTSEARMKLIKESIAKENVHNLRFEVKMLDDLVKEAIPWGPR